MKNPLKKKWLVPFIAGLLFGVICFVAINYAMEPVSTSEYCGSACHEMNESYTTWELSVHGNNKYGIKVECIDCHLPPREEFFTHITAKAYAGAKDLYMHHFGEEYDRQKQIDHVLEVFNSETCMHCHDNLLGKPSSPTVWEAHLASLANPELEENRCLSCHENVGHERKQKLFSQ